jgi:hypothetical protein
MLGGMGNKEENTDFRSFTIFPLRIPPKFPSSEDKDIQIFFKQ